MNVYVISICLVGLVALGITWIKHFANVLKISYSIIFVLIGIILFWTIEVLPWSLPQYNQTLTMRLTEIMVIIAVMGAGLKINTLFSLKTWTIPFRLIFITMPLTIICISAIGYWGLGLGVAASLLLGAALSPTDPVLAADVQVGPPNNREENPVKFSLTAEAGLSDGITFPIIWLAVSLAAETQTSDTWFMAWISYDLLYRISAGSVLGFLAGKLITYFFFYLPKKHDLAHIQEGLVALSTAFFVYGLTELVDGYGFIAVFICAITIRNYEVNHSYHKTLHFFNDQIEHILMAILLMLFGGSLVDGVLQHLNWLSIIAALIFVLMIRPICGMIALYRSKLSMKRRIAISFYGIRGVGSFFYLSFAFEHAQFKYENQLLSIVSLVVIISLLIHGLSAPSVMKKIE